MIRKLISVFASFLATSAGCSPNRPIGDEVGGNPTAVVISGKDVAIQAAIKEARDTVEQFVRQLASPLPDQSDFSVKVPIQDGGGTHFLWLQDVSFHDGRFEGKLGPDAQGLAGVAPGRAVIVDRTAIEDWMYVSSGKLVGGFSLRAIRGQLSGKAREQFEKSMWFSLD